MDLHLLESKFMVPGFSVLASVNVVNIFFRLTLKAAFIILHEQRLLLKQDFSPNVLALRKAKPELGEREWG